MRIVRLISFVALGWCAAACGSSDEQAATGGASGGAGGAGGAAGAGGGGASGAPPAEFCDGKTIANYDPQAGGTDIFPDDFFTIDDASSATGLMVHMVAGENIVVPPSGDAFKDIFADLSTLDGFGTTSAIAMSFSAPLDDTTLPMSGDATGDSKDSVVLVRLDGGGTANDFVKFGWELAPEDPGLPQTHLILTPMVPLVPKARYALAVTSRLHDADEKCIAPSETMKSLLDGSAEAPQLARLKDRHTDAIALLKKLGTIQSAEELSALAVFSTASVSSYAAAVGLSAWNACLTCPPASASWPGTPTKPWPIS